MKRILIWVLVIAGFLGSLWVGWTFRARNSLSLDLDLIWFRVPNVELWWLLVTSLLLGAGACAFVFGFIWLRGRLIMRRYRSAIRRLEKEVHELRSLPLVGSEPGGGDIDREPDLSSTAVTGNG